MQRLLHIILAFSILVTQSAWAIHMTLDGNELDGGHSKQLYSQSSEQHDESNDACNHFCHASAHLVGLFSDSNISLHANRDSHVVTSINIIVSFNDQPSIPPPIS